MRARTRRTAPGQRGDDLPAELQRRETRLARIREAKRALEGRAKAEAAAAGADRVAAKPEAKAQYNFTDPDSRIMKGPDGFVQAYNAQIAVDELQLIVGQAVTEETNDKKQLVPMITTIAEQSGQTPTPAPRGRRLLLGRLATELRFEPPDEHVELRRHRADGIRLTEVDPRLRQQVHRVVAAAGAQQRQIPVHTAGSRGGVGGAEILHEPRGRRETRGVLIRRSTAC